MVKILQHLRILKISYLRHAEHHANNRNSLCGLDQETLFLTDPVTPYLGGRVHARRIWAARVNDAASVRHFVLVGILDSVVVIEGMNDAKIDDQLVQHTDQVVVTI